MTPVDVLRTFPVLLSPRQESAFPVARRSVPWSLLVPHEEWAKRNHDQNLETLASRGGLSPDEMLAIIEHRRWRPVNLDEAFSALDRAIVLAEGGKAK